MESKAWRVRPDPVLGRLEARFDRAKRRLLRTDEGRWALVVQGTLQSEIEVFDTETEAAHAGFLHPSRKRFCVKPIVKREEPIVISAALGPFLHEPDAI
ncbi:hypothetical protein [Candidatus Poriferisodalis sp.]|uniref:hypothetical protein n=1 Tax=Candidatus Poriferisodalis sp. TaxID=3101277 RepID=UPI003B52A669